MITCIVMQDVVGLERVNQDGWCYSADVNGRASRCTQVSIVRVFH